MTAFSLVPRDKHFFKEFLILAQEIRSAPSAEADAGDRPARHGEGEDIKEIEHACDRRREASSTG